MAKASFCTVFAATSFIKVQASTQLSYSATYYLQSFDTGWEERNQACKKSCFSNSKDYFWDPEKPRNLAS